MSRIDITLPVTATMPHWPGSCAPVCEWETRLERGEESDASRWTLSSHQGTHIDAPSHFVRGGAGIEEVPLDRLLGPVLVVDVPPAPTVTVAHVELLVPAGTERVLLRTDNSRLRRLHAAFDPGYVGVTAAAAEELVRRGVRLVGVDYLSLECFGEGGFPAHLALLGAGVPIVEGLDLEAADPGEYVLTCLPIRLTGCEAAPARALLTSLGGS